MSSPIPSEFLAFVRETGIRAFDRVASKSRALDKSLQSVLKSWSKLSEAKKHELFDKLIASAQAEDEPVEEVPSRKRSVKRYDPEEVKLPGKIAKKSVKRKK